METENKPNNAGFTRVPRHVLRVGVTGPTAVDKAALEMLTDAVLEQLGSVNPEVVELVLVSCLAVGTDQIVASVARRRGHRLWGIVPSRRTSYALRMGPDEAERFGRLADDAEVLLELDLSLPDGDDPEAVDRRQRAYEAANVVMLQQSDVLIHVAAPGANRKPGGASSVGERARDLSLPVVLVRLDEHPPSYSPDGDALDKLIRGAFLGQANKLDLTEHLLKETDPRQRGFGKIGSRIWRAAVWNSLDKKAPPPDRPRATLACVTIGEFLVATAARALKRRPIERDPGRSERTIGTASEEAFASFRDPIRWLADHYAGLHRSAFLIMSLFGVFAVLFALLVPAVGEGHEDHLSQGQLGLVVAEAILILSMMAIYFVHSQQKWQERAIDYRLVAERLRHAQVLTLLARGSMPYAAGPAQWQPVDPRQSWAERYAKAVIREIGLTPLKKQCFDAGHLLKCRDYLVERWIAPQITYHHQNHARAERLHIILEALAVLALFATLVACIAHLVPALAAGWLLVPAGVLPAVGAACHGIDRQADLERIALRSEAMATRLSEIRLELSDPAIASDYVELTRIAEKAADIMIAEAGEWRVLFQTHPVPPPH